MVFGISYGGGVSRILLTARKASATARSATEGFARHSSPLLFLASPVSIVSSVKPRRIRVFYRHLQRSKCRMWPNGFVVCLMSTKVRKKRGVRLQLYNYTPLWLARNWGGKCPMASTAVSAALRLGLGAHIVAVEVFALLVSQFVDGNSHGFQLKPCYPCIHLCRHIMNLIFQ